MHQNAGFMMSKTVPVTVNFQTEIFGIIERRAKELNIPATHYLSKCVNMENFFNQQAKLGKEVYLHSFNDRVEEKVINL